jgi:hypothetical protein
MLYVILFGVAVGSDLKSVLMLQNVDLPIVFSTAMQFISIIYLAEVERS